MAKRVMSKDNEVPDVSFGNMIDPDQYNAIARCANLLGIQLIESRFNIAPSFFDHEGEEAPALDFVELHSSFDEKSRVATCIFSLEAFKRHKRAKLFSIKDKFVVFYRISADCDEYHATAFARKVGLMACYPYFRAHAASTASMANADMPVLPTIATMPLRNATKKEKAE